MREIKFRAWEKSLNEIIPVHNIDFKEKQINTNGAWRMFDEIELMQYTGLKNKNGIEIYEGDVLEHDYENATVEWNSKYARFEFAMRYDGDSEVCERLSVDNWTSINHFEVIGNIHQNISLDNNSGF